MRLGARTFKTGFAVFLAIFISDLLGMEPTIVAAIAAVLTIQPSVYKSWRHLFEQIQGNVIGAVLALIALVYVGNSPIVISLVVMLSIVINLKLGYDKTISLVIFTIIAIMQGSEGNELMYAVNRLSLVMIGIISSIAINVLFLPPKYESKLKETIIKIKGKSFAYLRLLENEEAPDKTLKEEKKIIDDLLKKAETLYELYKDEYEGKIIKKKYSQTRKLAVYKEIMECVQLFNSVVNVLEKMNVSSVIPQNLLVDCEKHVTEVAIYYEKIMMKFDKKIDMRVSLDKEHSLTETNISLLTKIIEYHQKEDTDEMSTMHLFSLVSGLTELIHELNHLEKMMEQLHTFHVDKHKK